MTAKQQSIDQTNPARYEYRVWGRHRKPRKLLERLASSATDERVKDCYLLVGDSTWNAKVRNNTLKVKELIEEDRGFERWAADRPRSADDAPSPFDELFDQLRLDRPQRGKSYDLSDEISRLDRDTRARAIFVVKHRRRYTVGHLRAEATDIRIIKTSKVLHTIAIEGDDLRELVALRKKIGLRGEPNVAVHDAISSVLDS